MTNEERFWRSVEKVGPCWLWRGSRERDGYGQFRYPDGRKQAAHRFAYELKHGPIPEGMIVMHVCDTPNCVRPSHLRVGTHAENMEDRNMKKRHARGERHGHSKLTKNQVRIIRIMAAKGNYTYRELGERFGVCSSTVGSIVRRERWIV